MTRSLFAGGLALAACAVQAQAPDAATVARLHVQATDHAVGRTLAYCLVRAPAHAGAVNAAWQGWRQRYQIDAMRRMVDPALYDKVMAGLAQNPEKLEATLVAQGPAEKVCATFPATLNDASMNMRTQYPAAYAQGLPAVAPAAPPAPAPQPQPQPQPATDPQRTAPGKGIPRGDIVAVLYSRSGLRLLLKDGWAYGRNGIPPSDLDVQASREREPQHWHRWKKEGKDYFIRHADTRGQLGDTWQKADSMWAVKPWPDGASISGEFIHANFSGSIAGGGTYSQDSWRFGTDGRFSTSAYTQSSAGSWAGMNGYSSAQTSYSGANGSSASSNVMAGGGAFSSEDARRQSDGAGRRGTYRVDGYTLELQYDNGAVRRLFAFPWSSSGTSINGRSFITDPSQRKR